MVIRSPQTSLLQCPFTQPLFPATLAAQGRSLFGGSDSMEGGRKTGLELGRVSEHSPLSSTVDTQDDGQSFLQACWLVLISGLPGTHQLQPRLLWRPLLCSQQRCFLFQQQETKTRLGETRESQPTPLVKLPD